MLKLIINADDLGLADGCNQGIVRGLTEGIVSDTTLMINTDFTQAAVDLLKKNGIFQAGLHLNLSFGVPVSQAPSLVDGQGFFHRKIAGRVSGINLEEVISELSAQLTKFQATGLRLTHLDGHHHVHAFPEIIDITLGLAKKAGVPVRQTGSASQERIIAAGVTTTDFFTKDFYGQEVSNNLLQQQLLRFSDGVLEIMCHPATYDPRLYDISSYNSCREKELSILTDPAMKEFLQDNQIKLISFADLN